MNTLLHHAAKGEESCFSSPKLALFRPQNYANLNIEAIELVDLSSVLKASYETT
jgi:hypothetical protein